ncbi:hypothetical protein [Thermocatellispora tengchongensis]|uniref:hypothetical protein n=1 Tax=Thermocatellispora tengchongensis TaxID=1073253 RepID=UPI00336D7179
MGVSPVSTARVALASTYAGTPAAAKIAELTNTAGTDIANPDVTIPLVAAKLRFTEEHQQQILRHFIKGGDLSAGGVMHAVTSVAQTIPDADIAHDMETQAIRAMRLAAAV